MTALRRLACLLASAGFQPATINNKHTALPMPFGFSMVLPTPALAWRDD